MTPLRAATGRGVRVAIVDTGVRVTPETGPVAGGMSLVDERWHDETGHGTAVAATLRSLAPDAEMLAVKVFDRHLATTAALVAEGIRWAARRAAHVINVSAGALTDAGGAVVDEAILEATRAGALVVAPAADGPGSWSPRSVPGLVVVTADPECPPDGLRRSAGQGAGFSASPECAPLAGIPRDRVPRGVSFATARVAAWVCRARQVLPDFRGQDLCAALDEVCDVG